MKVKLFLTGAKVINKCRSSSSWLWLRSSVNEGQAFSWLGQRSSVNEGQAFSWLGLRSSANEGQALLDYWLGLRSSVNKGQAFSWLGQRSSVNEGQAFSWLGLRSSPNGGQIVLTSTLSCVSVAEWLEFLALLSIEGRPSVMVTTTLSTPCEAVCNIAQSAWLVSGILTISQRNCSSKL